MLTSPPGRESSGKNVTQAWGVLLFLKGGEGVTIETGELLMRLAREAAHMTTSFAKAIPQGRHFNIPKHHTSSCSEGLVEATEIERDIVGGKLRQFNPGTLGPQVRAAGVFFPCWDPACDGKVQ